MSSAAAERAGLHPYRAPTGVNSVDYDGRPACVDCGFCGGYGCPIHAKGDPIASLQRALRTGRCELRPDAYVTEIVLDGTGRRATGVRYLDLTGYPDPPTVEVHATRAVVLAGGAFETPRLLLRNGLGGDLVGRFLTYHFQTFTVGIFPEPTGGERGRSVTHLHDDLMIDTPELRAAARAAGLPWLRGGVVEHGAGPGPDRRGRAPTRRGEAHLRVDGRQRAAPPAVGVHDAGRGPPPGDATASTSTRRCATRGASRPVASPTRRTATSWPPPPTPRRSTRR